MAEAPLVSIVTPVFNGAEHLAECSASVRAQTYPHFEHVVLDNASTDGTGALAAAHATADPRVRVLTNLATLPMIANWNRALSLVSPRARYVRILPADDMLLPCALERLVEAAERTPGVGVVGSLRLRGETVQSDGLDPAQTVLAGRDAVRLFLREEVFALAPTASLIRADLIRARQPFLPSEFIHADMAALFDVLDQVDFAFVHEVLMYSRPHERSVTATIVERRQTWLRERLLMLHRYGHRYFTPAELDELERRTLRRYYRFLVRSTVTLQGRPLLAYHYEALRQVRRAPGPRQLLDALLGELGRSIARPDKVVRHVRTRIAQP